jgi:ATP-binding cassette subfamily B protein
MERLRRFWLDYAHRYRWVYLLGLVCLGLTTLATVAVPVCVELAIDALARDRDTTSASLWAGAIVVLGLGLIGVRTLSRILFFNPGRTVEFRMKNRLFEQLTHLPRTYFDRVPAGDLVSRGTNDMANVRALVGFAVLALLNLVLTALFTLGQMLLTHWELALWCTLPLVVALAILKAAVGTLHRLTSAAQAELGKLSSLILESYNGATVLQAFQAVPQALGRFDASNGELLRLGLTVTRVIAWLLPIVPFVSKLSVVILLYLGSRRMAEGDLTLGELSAFIVYVDILATALQTAGWTLSTVQRGWIGLERVNAVIDAPLERPAPVPGAVPSPEVRGAALEVSGLDFSYAPRDGEGTMAPGGSAAPPRRASLRNIAFRVAPGERLGIFGLTGAGKSTLLNLLARVYDPPQGTVRLGGADVRDLPVDAYWRAVAYVPQEAFLFSRSLRSNIALAELPDRIDRDRSEAAALDAALGPDLAALPEGLETLVGERGIMLSGGQRQRAALARAFYRDFRVLLLDDVLSAVDHPTERRLIDAIYRRGAGATLVIVSHRASVLARADRILVLDEGQVVAEGTHAELLAPPHQEGPYARAWRVQKARDWLEGEEAAG